MLDIINTLINIYNFMIKLSEFANGKETLIIFIITFLIYNASFEENKNIKLQKKDNVSHLIEKLIDNEEHENATNLLKSYISHENLKTICITVIMLTVIIAIVICVLSFLKL